ncbi:MATE family efflux transporter [Selenomonas sp. TAMA-11512]|uniref:MATE family efflux transporter n=1 Tax=Selenomonas sp. TAMA-11512 TaxID=3095337 RepID=UPI00308D4E9C|nr:MATE family efflux transporter [Selenomonas sp. TAMA-11512]
METAAHNPLARRYRLWSLFRYTLPPIGMMIVVSLYTVIDGIFVGHYVGSNGLAAINIVFPTLNVMYGLAIMLSSGGSALVAKAMGEGDMKNASRRFTFLTVAGISIGILLAGMVFLFYEPILRFLGTTELLWDMGTDYLLSCIAFAPCVIMMIFFNAFYIADGRPIQGFFVSIASGVTNVVFDYIFIAKLGMGVLGAGLATGLSDVVALLAGVWYFMYYSRLLHFRRFRFEASVLLRSASNGSSEMVTQLSAGVTTFLFNMLLLEYAGEMGVAAITVILYSEMILNAFFMGFGLGVAPIFSYQFGAQNFRELRRLLQLSLTNIGLFSILSFAAANLFRVPLTELFLPEGGEVFDITVHGFQLFAYSFLITGCNLFASNFYTALSDGKTSAFLSFLRNLFGIVLFLLTLPRVFGLDGIWLAVPAADVLAIGVGAALLWRTAGKMKSNEPAPHGGA